MKCLCYYLELVKVFLDIKRKSGQIIVFAKLISCDSNEKDVICQAYI